MNSLTDTYVPAIERQEDTLLVILMRHASRVGHFRDYNDAIRWMDQGRLDRAQAIVDALPKETKQQVKEYEREAQQIAEARLLIARRGQFFREPGENLR